MKYLRVGLFFSLIGLLAVLLTGCFFVGMSPVASLTADPQSGPAPLTVDFHATDSEDPDGDIAQYSWDYGDGPPVSGPSLQTPSHKFQDDGTYKVTLTVTDGQGNEGQATTTIEVSNPAPEPQFSYSPDSPLVGENIQFTAASSLDPATVGFDPQHIVEYSWDFHDDTTGTGKTIVHSYSSAGDYGVELTLEDDDGATAEAVQTVSVTVNDSPNASFLASSQTGSKEVEFDASGSTDPDGSITYYEWDFNTDVGSGYDRGASTPTTSYTYSQTGSYTVKLKATDDIGAYGTVSCDINVQTASKTVQTCSSTI